MDAISLPEITPKIIPPKTNTQELPPWNGYGSHADSAGNCNTIEPKAPRCDFFKFLHKDRYNFIFKWILSIQTYFFVDLFF